MLADAEAASAAAEAACMAPVAACKACMMSGGYRLLGAEPGGKADGGVPAPRWPGPKGGYGRGPKGPNGPTAPGNNGNPDPFDGDPALG